MSGITTTMPIVRHSEPMVFLAAAAPVLARDEALASGYVALARRLLRNPPADAESVYLATFADDPFHFDFVAASPDNGVPA